MSTRELLAIASPIAAAVDLGDAIDRVGKGRLRRELAGLLAQSNGFFAFESALHVRHLGAAQSAPSPAFDVLRWNERDLWRSWYGHAISDLFFFAEDTFGCQFALLGDERIVSFDPESGHLEGVADSIDAWASAILKDYESLTGYPLAHAWQAENGKLSSGKRLLPKIPFILGGAFDIDNLVAVNELEAMRYRGELWMQLRDLPDGARVQLKALPLH